MSQLQDLTGRLRGWLRAVRRELGQGLPRLAFLIVLVAMSAVLWSKGTTWGGRWNALAEMSRQNLIAIAPIAVSLAAWQGGRARRDRMGELQRSTRASAMSRNSVEIVALWVAAFAGWLVAVALAGLSIVRLDGWGTAAAVYQFAGVGPMLIAYVALGFAIGKIAPWRIVAPIAGLATYLVIGITSYVSDSAMVVLGVGWLGDDISSPFALLPFWLSTVGLLLVGLAMIAAPSVERRPAPEGATRIVALAAAAAALVIAPLTLTTTTAAAVAQTPITPAVVCTEDDGPKVCVHAQDHLLLEETTRQARAVIDQLRDIEDAPTWAGPWGLDRDDRSKLPTQPAWITPLGDIDITYGEPQLVNISALFDAEPSCEAAGRWPVMWEGEPPKGWADFMDRQGILWGWLTHSTDGVWSGSDGEQLSKRFAASSDRQRVAFASAVRSAALTCDLDAVRAADDLLAPISR